MKRNKNTKNTLYCFSPPVMVATIIIEVALALYTLVRFPRSALKTIAIATLLLLAAFQFAEFQVCANTLGRPELWSRLGYVAITFLPILGVQAMSIMAGRKNRQLLVPLYGLGAAFGVYFTLSPQIFTSTICSGNYVLFELQPVIAGMYYLFYNAVLFSAVGLALVNRRKERNSHIKAAYTWFVVGYASFLIPTGVVYVMRPTSFAGLPSIMCGFAVVFALIMALRILPLATGHIRKRK